MKLLENDCHVWYDAMYFFK